MKLKKGTRAPVTDAVQFKKGTKIYAADVHEGRVCIEEATILTGVPHGGWLDLDHGMRALGSCASVHVDEVCLSPEQALWKLQDNLTANLQIRRRQFVKLRQEHKLVREFIEKERKVQWSNISSSGLGLPSGSMTNRLKP